MSAGPDWIITLEYARRWRCRPSEADEEPAIWALRQNLYDQTRAQFGAPFPDEDDD